MNGVRFCGLVCAALLLGGEPASARDLFRTLVAVGAATSTNGVNSILDVPDLLDESSLTEDFGPSYIPDVSAVSGTINLRGLSAFGGFDADSATLAFSVPAAGVDVSFDGGTRDESNDQLEDWLKGEGSFPDASDESLEDLLQALVEFSPVEPVAGNPNSLQSRMFESALGLGTLSPFLGDFPDASEDIPNVVALDLDFGYYAAGPFNGQTYDFSIGFGWNFARRLAIVTDINLLLNRVEGDALAGFGDVGLGVVGRINDWWNLSVVARGGLVGSLDVGALATMYSVSFINHMRFELGFAQLEMSNMVGVANTLPGFDIEGWDLEYDLTNVVLKNRLAVSRMLPFSAGSRSLRGTLYLTDTQYFVDDLWLEHTDEIGLEVGLASERGGAVYDPATLDIAYVVGKSYDALKLRLSLRF